MNSAALRARIGPRFSTDFGFRETPPPETLSTGIPAVDCLTGGISRGAITEIYGPISSGRTSLLIRLVAEATGREESCALVDVSGSLDPQTAAAAGVDLSRLVWIRCNGNVEHALRATDLLIEGGGFGLVIMDLSDAPSREARRIPLASWFRFRQAVAHTPTVFLVADREPHVSCASHSFEMRCERVCWSGIAGSSRLLRGVHLRLETRKPVRSAAASFEMKALAG